MPNKLDRLSSSGLIRLAAEAVLLFLVAWAPWPFASAEYAYESILIGGTAFIVLLWLVHGLFSGQLHLRPDPVAYCLLGLVLLSAIQLIPLPASIVGVVSPSRLQLHEAMLPEQFELLPGETVAETRATWIPITFDPDLTRIFLTQTLAMLLLYLAVRSWVASRESLRRIAWVATINGIALAVLGLTQFFSSDHNVVFWSVITEGAVFGPFVCKNHYPDYVLFCLGLGVALLLTKQLPKSVKVRGVEYRQSLLTRLTDSPDLVILAVGLVLVVLSIPFTLSRGGLLGSLAAAMAAAALVYRTRGGVTRSMGWGIGLVGAALLLGAGFGWGIVSQRLDTLWTGQATAERGVLWNDVSKLVPSLLAVGGGNGAFPRFEQPSRTALNPERMMMDNAHNEYLEAVLEGGVLRLALTLALVAFALRIAMRAYSRLADRSSGPLILGIVFGLVGLAVHSVVDFGIHVPAVAFLTTVLMAYAADAATDPTYIPFKKKEQHPPPDPGRLTVRGLGIVGLAAVLVPLCGWLMLESSKRSRAGELKVIARDAARQGGIDQNEVRLQALTAAVALTPGDADAWALLARAQFNAAADESRVAAMALAGRPAIAALPPEAFTTPHGERIQEGLRAARTARTLSPLIARSHIYLGLYHGGLARSEPARVHFDRAVRACPSDPQIYIARGSEAAARRDFAAAVQDWHQALRLQPTRMPEVLTAARRDLGVSATLRQIVPAEPLPLWLAAAQLCPPSKAGLSLDRAECLQRLAALDANDNWDGRGWEAIARAHTELGHIEPAFNAWNKAIAKAPDAYDLRDRYALWLEADERDDLAEAQLLWLRDRRDHPTLADRLDAVRHSRKLKAILDTR